MEPRIKPIDYPKGVVSKIMYRQLKKQFGKVILPAKVIYARYKNIGLLVNKLLGVTDSFKLISTEEKILIQSLVASINGCSFCMDLSRQNARNERIKFHKLLQLMDFRSTNEFSKREIAVLSFVEEMTNNLEVSDETYQSLSKYCSDEEIIEITYTATAENFLNRLLKPLKIGSDDLCPITNYVEI